MFYRNGCARGALSAAREPRSRLGLSMSGYTGTEAIPSSRRSGGKADSGGQRRMKPVSGLTHNFYRYPAGFFAYLCARFHSGVH